VLHRLGGCGGLTGGIMAFKRLGECIAATLVMLIAGGYRVGQAQHQEETDHYGRQGKKELHGSLH